MTDPITWPTVAEQRPPLGARCEYFVDGNGWSSSGTGVWVDCDSELVSGFEELRGVMISDPAQTHWRMADGPAVPEGREPASVAPEARPLSPAAQAVLDAVCDAPHCGSGLAKAVAALRALADHRQAPITPGQPIDFWSPDFHTRRELRNYAAELEGQP